LRDSSMVQQDSTHTHTHTNTQTHTHTHTTCYTRTHHSVRCYTRTYHAQYTREPKNLRRNRGVHAWYECLCGSAWAYTFTERHGAACGMGKVPWLAYQKRRRRYKFCEQTNLRKKCRIYESKLWGREMMRYTTKAKVADN